MNRHLAIIWYQIISRNAFADSTETSTLTTHDIRLAFLLAFHRVVLHPAVENLSSRSFVLRRLEVWLKAIWGLDTNESSSRTWVSVCCLSSTFNTRSNLWWPNFWLFTSSCSIAKPSLVTQGCQHFLLFFLILRDLVALRGRRLRVTLKKN